jgi:hypothetical protein
MSKVPNAAIKIAAWHLQVAAEIGKHLAPRATVCSKHHLTTASDVLKSLFCLSSLSRIYVLRVH